MEPCKSGRLLTQAFVPIDNNRNAPNRIATGLWRALSRWDVADEKTGKRTGLIMYSIVNRDGKFPWKTIFHELDRSLFQEDGRFVEIFQLWVAPEYRRSGIATKLKLKLEELAKKNDVNLIYTHTEERNKHVLELNEKLGYRIVRRGPIWDEIVRVSLIKQMK